MTNQEMVEKFMKAHDLKVYKSGNDFTPIMPFILLDAMLIVYQRHLSKYPFVHKAKKVKGYWMDSYKEFNNGVFLSCYTDEEKDEIIDKKMETLSNHINSNLYDLMAQVRLAIKDTASPKDIEAIGALQCCNILIQAAQCYWLQVYQKWPTKCNPKVHEYENPYLSAMDGYTDRLTNMIHNSPMTIKLSDNQFVSAALARLVSRMREWLNGEKFESNDNKD